MRAIHYLSACYLFLALLSSCGGSEVRKPAIEPVTERLKAEQSIVRLPIILPVSELEDVINKELGEVIHQDDSYDYPNNDHTKLEVTRNGRIQVTMNGNHLHSTFPLRVWVKAKKLVAVETEFSVVLKIVSDIRIDEDWRPVLNSRFESLKWTENPDLDIAFIKIDLTSKVGKTIEEKMPEMLEKLDQVAHQQISLRPTVAKVWGNMQKPILVNKEYEKIWLVAQPQSITLEGKLNAYDGLIHINANVASQMRFYFGDEPDVEKKELPPLKHSESQEKNFDINLLANVPFEEMAEKALKELQKKPIKVGEYQAQVEALTIEGSKELLVVTLGLSGDMEGEIYCTGVPKYDSATSDVFIDQFKYDIKTENMLAQSANWLLHNDATNMIQRELRLSLKPFSDKVPSLISHGVEKGKTGEKISVSFKNFSFYPKKMLVTNESIQVMVNAKGEVVLALDELN